MGSARALIFIAALLGSLFFWFTPVSAASVEVYDLEILPQSSALEPRQPFTLTIKGRWPGTITAAVLDYTALVTDFSVQDVQISTGTEAGQTLYQAILQLQVERPGLYVFPPLQLPLLQDAEQQAVAVSSRLFLEIPKGAAATADLRPNKPLQSMPWNLSTFWWGLGIGLLVLFGILAWLHRRRRQVPEPIDPYAEWLSGLRQVRDLAIPDARIDKQVAFELSHAIRCYMERRSSITALEMTGSELARALARAPVHVRLRWEALVDRCHALELIKYRPGAIGEQSVAEWISNLARMVDTVEADVQAEQKQKDPE